MGLPGLPYQKLSTTYPSGAPEFTPGFLWSLCYSIFSFMCLFCRPLFVLLYFFFWPLCCLFFFDLRMHNYPFGVFELFLKWLWLFCCRPLLVNILLLSIWTKLYQFLWSKQMIRITIYLLLYCLLSATSLTFPFFMKYLYQAKNVTSHVCTLRISIYPLFLRFFNKFLNCCDIVVLFFILVLSLKVYIDLIHI